MNAYRGECRPKDIAHVSFPIGLPLVHHTVENCRKNYS